MRYVIAITETGSFTRAAEQCHVVQSALSHQIAKLERELGATLFVRGHRQVRLTPAGEAFLRPARQAVTAAETARDEVAAISGLLRGTLRVGTIGTFTAFDLATTLGLFRERHANVEFTVVGRGSELLIGDIRRGELDVGLVGLPKGYPMPPDVNHRQLRTDTFTLLTSREHRLAAGRRRKVPLAELVDETFVDWPADSQARAETDEAFEAAGLPRRVEYEVNHIDLIVRFVRASLAIALVPEGTVDPAPDIPQLALANPPKRAQSIVWSRTPSPAARAFLDLVRDHAPQKPRP